VSYSLLIDSPLAVVSGRGESAIFSYKSTA